MIPHPDLLVLGAASGLAACVVALLVRRSGALALPVATIAAALLAVVSGDATWTPDADRWPGELPGVAAAAVAAIGVAGAAVGLAHERLRFAPHAVVVASAACGVLLTVPDTEVASAVAAAASVVALAGIVAPGVLAPLPSRTPSALGAVVAGATVALGGLAGSLTLADAASVIATISVAAAVAVPGRRAAPWPSAALAGASCLAVSRLTVRVDEPWVALGIGAGALAVTALALRSLPLGRPPSTEP